MSWTVFEFMLRPPGLELEEKTSAETKKTDSRLPASSRFSGKAGEVAAAL
jgi:hypothetical protein